MSEQELLELIRKTVMEWAVEEFVSNQDSEVSLTLGERYHENAMTFMNALRVDLMKGFSPEEEKFFMENVRYD